ncbi:MOSC N-terminal beta barrel domain-containing protein [Nonomuraea recticatena]|uniref:MOSC N-terminal beta barrel domain-containing protein n=1 Tax=Nonomuraea recticatena TaxID=46178 RepID=UPI0036212B7B
MGEMLGTVEVLRRYPVKGLLGEEIPAVDVAATGLTGDRGLALVDAETGKVASPKNPRVWRGMLALSAAIDSGGVRVSLPDGESVRAGDPHVDEVLSRALGRKVTLTSTPPRRRRWSGRCPRRCSARV